MTISAISGPSYEAVQKEHEENFQVLTKELSETRLGRCGVQHFFETEEITDLRHKVAYSTFGEAVAKAKNEQELEEKRKTLMQELQKSLSGPERYLERLMKISDPHDITLHITPQFLLMFLQSHECFHGNHEDTLGHRYSASAGTSRLSFYGVELSVGKGRSRDKAKNDAAVQAFIRFKKEIDQAAARYRQRFPLFRAALHCRLLEVIPVHPLASMVVDYVLPSPKSE